MTEPVLMLTDKPADADQNVIESGLADYNALQDRLSRLAAAGGAAA